jgi:hypothetical protein
LAKVVRISWSSPSNITFQGREDIALEYLGYSDEEWDALSEPTQWQVLDEACTETLVNLVEIDAVVIDE